MVNVDERTIKQKFTDFKNKLKWKAQDTLNWIKDNPQSAATIATASVVVVKTTYKIVKAIIAVADDRDRRREVYCNDIQSTVRLKRELNYHEQRELRDRMNSGQSKFEALDDMNLLRRR